MYVGTGVGPQERGSGVRLQSHSFGVMTPESWVRALRSQWHKCVCDILGIALLTWNHYAILSMYPF